ncbi:MAG: hypothetical protein K2K05_02910, partial [Muribaculaceae bacterium]|nr:hypothetical protein [Muribaculaceae bacterium]
YNNDGCTPPNYGAFERYALGWLDPDPITGAEEVTLRPVGENVARIIPSDNPNEYFLLENRQQTGWDTYIPGHGMLVWHIDYDPVRWAANTVNNSIRHQCVDIEEADGKLSSGNRDGDAFPGTQGVTSFTDDTYPSMRLWDGTAMNRPLTEIAEDSVGIITFKVVPEEIDGIADAISGLRIRISGSTVSIDDAPDMPVFVSDLAGRKVAVTATDPTGHVEISIPATGIYLIRVGDKHAKIIHNS